MRFVNDSPVTLPVLREIAVRLVDIHSQHQEPIVGRTVLPTYHNRQSCRNRGSACRLPQGICGISQEAEKYTETRELIRRNRLDADFIAFQYEELMNMELSPGEHESLERERDILANLGEVQERLDAALAPPQRGAL